MFIELQAIYLILKKYKENPLLTKREMDIVYDWKLDKPENNRPLSEKEVEEYKAILKKHAPSSYNSLEEK